MGAINDVITDLCPLTIITCAGIPGLMVTFFFS